MLYLFYYLFYYLYRCCKIEMGYFKIEMGYFKIETGFLICRRRRTS